MSIVYIINAEGVIHTCGEWDDVRPAIFRDGLLHKDYEAYCQQETTTMQRGTRKEWFKLCVDADSNAHFWKIVYANAPVMVLLAQMIAEEQ